MSPLIQQQQAEWSEQWSLFQDHEAFLFRDWIAPFSLEGFQGREVLECGCGGGHHTVLLARVAKSVTAVDLNTVEIARERSCSFDNVTVVPGDIGTMDLGRGFDVVVAVGVVHHTDDPDRTVANLKRHLHPGGTLILWVYSREGNWPVRWIVEPLRKLLLRRLPRQTLVTLSRVTTALLYPVVHTVYRLPLPFLPYYEYFANFRRLSFLRNTLNVFDKLNAPQVDFISRNRAAGWVADMENATIRPYKGVSYSIVATRPQT